jgi:hypothetical protein
VQINFDAIPVELRQLNQWVLWRYEDIGAKKPTKVPYSSNGNHADVTKQSTWGSFQDVFNTFNAGGYSGIGFVFSSSDRYFVIDLDDTNGDQEAFERQLKIYKEFDTYSELSPSGKGVHLIGIGKVPSGRRRSFIEIYSSERYITFTGNVHNQKPIKDCQEILTQLWDQMGGTVNNISYDGNSPEPAQDSEILTRALNAVNGDKFDKLLNGNWNEIYQSQSEADYAFIDIIAFYTQNKAQIARIFRASKLGQRKKALRVDYVDKMILQSFDKMTPPIDFDGFKNALDEIKAKGRVAQGLEPSAHNGLVAGSSPATTTNQAGSSNGKTAPFEGVNVGSTPTPATTIPLPPGLIGYIAQFIYAAAPRPVHEIALAGAIGLMAGICGKAYNISNSGLNQYILLLAKTGMGKEGMAAGIDKLMGAVKMSVPTSTEFIGPAYISSGQALVKHIHSNPCFVSILGEFGLRVQAMSGDNASAHEKMLKQVLLEVYQKSGSTDIFRPSIYADREKNTDASIGPAFSILGESVPSSFYNALTEEMIIEGLLPRFLLIEYNGIRVELNKNAATVQPPFQLVEMVSQLAANCKQLMHNNKVISIKLNEEAQRLADNFDSFTTAKINQTSNEVVLNLWNRAHLKALKLAGLIAVGVNPFDPIVTPEYMIWAIEMIQTDIIRLSSKFETGEVGTNTGENKQQKEILRIVQDFIKKEYSEIETYMGGGINPAQRQVMHSNRVIPFAYISRRLISAAAFKNDRLGATTAIKRAITTLIESDKLREVPRTEMQSKYGSTQKAYVVSDLGIVY